MISQVSKLSFVIETSYIETRFQNRWLVCGVRGVDFPSWVLVLVYRVPRSWVLFDILTREKTIANEETGMAVREIFLKFWSS